MNRPSCFPIFSKSVLLLSCFLMLGCLGDVSTSGSSSSNSVGICPGEGGLFPSPVAPQSASPIDPMGLSQNLFLNKKGVRVLPQGTELVVLMNEICLHQNSSVLKLDSTPIPKNGSPATRLPQRAFEFALQDEVSEKDVLKWIHDNPCLIRLEQNHRLQKTETLVNDPQSSSQTHLASINAFLAWDTFYADLANTEVIIAIIDDGMDLAHPDLSPHLWVNADEIPNNGVDDDANGYVDDVHGYNFASNLPSPAAQGAASHGTHVAGLAAAQDNNSLGITGVMGRHVKIMPLNVFGTSGGAGLAAIANAIDYARAQGAHVINLSLGGPGFSEIIRLSMVNAAASGSFLAIAAGNDNVLITEYTNFYIPMGYAKDIPGAISVGSVDAITKERSSFSNYSTTYVEIGAPGSDDVAGGLLSTLPSSSYGYKQGTSMASPVVAGAAALMIGWAQSRGLTLSPAQVEAALKSSADASGALSSEFMGGALLNLANLADYTGCF